ncbi:GIY-YIG nuclease family protein [Citromicrobium bathyomarinum]
MITFSELLERDGFDPSKIVVFRHRPMEPELNRNFDWIVAERPDLFDCYQNTHGTRTESALKRANYVASFLRHGLGAALFLGFFKIRGWRDLTSAEWAARPSHVELVRYGMSGASGGASRETISEFDLVETSYLAAWKHRLVIDWPGLERSWYRWADRNTFSVKAIAQADQLAGELPSWDQIALTFDQLAIMPTSWKSALRQWRGIYLITDMSDRMAYVGSAGGSENLLQRWTDYSKSGHGGNKLLKRRDPKNFVFSILQRTSPDLDRAELLRLENSWKVRLLSRAPYGLNEN